MGGRIGRPETYPAPPQVVRQRTSPRQDVQPRARHLPPSPPQVNIRLLERTDVTETVKLIRQLLYTEAGKSCALDSMRAYGFLIFLIASSLIVYFLYQSIWPANLWFVFWPAMGYFTTPRRMSRNEYDRGSDMRSIVEFFKFWTRQGRLKLVAEINMKVMGTIGTVDISPEHVVITRIATDPWIKKYQIRERLLRMVLVLCRDRGVETVDLHTFHPKRHEQSFNELYESLGFQLASVTLKGYLPFFRVKCYKYTYTFTGNDVASSLMIEDEIIDDKKDN